MSGDADEELMDALCGNSTRTVAEVEKQIRHDYADTPGLADRIIGSTMFVYHQNEMLLAERRTLREAIDVISAAEARFSMALDKLTGHLYDVEVVEGDPGAMRFAATGIRLHVAALRHLTRHTTPEDKEARVAVTEKGDL